MANQRSTRSKQGGGTRGGMQQQKRFVAAVIIIVVMGIAILAAVASHHQTAVPAVTAIDSTIPASEAKGYTIGSPNAPVLMQEFADFECPACGNYAVVTEPDVRKRLVETGQLRVTYYDFPLPMHHNTWWASHAAACANDQGKFWEMHDLLFAGQNDWNGEATSDPLPIMQGYAKQLGLDVTKWRSCVDNRTHEREIEANRANAEAHHVQQTPTFVIGNRMLAGSVSYDEIKAYVDSARAEQHPSKT